MEEPVCEQKKITPYSVADPVLLDGRFELRGCYRLVDVRYVLQVGVRDMVRCSWCSVFAFNGPNLCVYRLS